MAALLTCHVASVARARWLRRLGRAWPPPALAEELPLVGHRAVPPRARVIAPLLLRSPPPARWWQGCRLGVGCRARSRRGRALRETPRGPGPGFAVRAGRHPNSRAPRSDPRS